jgi:hypothetical protein
MTIESADRDGPYGVVSRLVDSAADRAAPMGPASGKESCTFQ